MRVTSFAGSATDVPRSIAFWALPVAGIALPLLCTLLPRPWLPISGDLSSAAVLGSFALDALALVSAATLARRLWRLRGTSSEARSPSPNLPARLRRRPPAPLVTPPDLPGAGPPHCGGGSRRKAAHSFAGRV